MTQDPEAFPIGGLSLQDVAQRMCRSEWEASQQAEKELVVAGGRLPTREKFARASAALNGGSLAPMQPERTQAIAHTNQTYQSLDGAVLGIIKSSTFDLMGIFKGGHEETKIPRALLDSARIVNLQKSIISTEGNRRFECVRVFMAAPAIATISPQAAAAAAEPFAGEQQQIRGGLRKRPVADAVAVALKNVGLDLSRGSLTLEEVAGKISSLMPKSCTTESQIAALVAALKRHYKDVISKGRAGNVVSIVPRPRAKNHMK